MAAPVVGDHPVTVMEKEHHLGIAVVRRQRPAMAETIRSLKLTRSL